MFKHFLADSSHHLYLVAPQIMGDLCPKGDEKYVNLIKPVNN
jgi:hypothetical protein